MIETNKSDIDQKIKENSNPIDKGMELEDGFSRYEISYVLVAQDDVSDVLKVLGKYGITPYSSSAINNIRLAYPIKKHFGAFFGFSHFIGRKADIKKISNELMLNPKLLRFLIVNPPILPRQRSEKFQPREGADGATNEAIEDKIKEMLNK